MRMCVNSFSITRKDCMCVYICVYIYIYQINNNRNVMDERMDGEMNTWIVSNFLKMYSYSSGFSGISQ